ncbi:MAG TPA: DUF427 domain-containing protein [Ilumatobacteraceae bacterium]|nr:DUF427 domain-containing protein [Ilumatobacteraceae bacterium]
MSENRIRLEPNHRRLRALVDGVVIADTTASVYLFETGHLPVYYLPKSHIRFDLLEHTDHSTHCPYKGDAEYWSIVVGDRRIDDAVWSYPSPLPDAPDLSAYAAFYWNKIDNWFEEDEEVFVHARDPYHRVDALRSSRHVEVRVNGETVADTTRPTLLFETGLPTRYYIPKLDVRMDLLRSSPLTTACPYKGTANYYSVAAPGADVIENVVWFYRTPIPQIPTIENMVCFFNEKVDIVVDGDLQERPRTSWS